MQFQIFVASPVPRESHISDRKALGKYFRSKWLFKCKLQYDNEEEERHCKTQMKDRACLCLS